VSERWRARHWRNVGLAVGLLALQSSGAHAATVTYKYDELGRLTRASYDNGVVIEYAYDPAGNRTSHVVSGPGLPSGNKWGNFTWGTPAKW